MSAGAPSRSGVLRSTSSLRKAPTDSSWLQLDNSMISGTACSGGSSHKEGLTGWVHLQGRDGDQINAGLAVAGYNFTLLLRLVEPPLRALIRALLAVPVWLQTP